MSLKYLFTALFGDGTTYTQHPEDLHPNHEGKAEYNPNSFRFVLDEAEKRGGIIQFILKGEGHTYLVDLSDGHFEIDDLPFEAHAQELMPHDLRLVYFREKEELFYPDGKHETVTRRYFLGWQMTHQGKNYQQTISIN